MTNTLRTIRQEVGRDLAECVVGLVDSATTLAIVDADLQDTEESASRYQGGWIWPTQAAEPGTLGPECLTDGLFTNEPTAGKWVVRLTAYGWDELFTGNQADFAGYTSPVTGLPLTEALYQKVADMAVAPKPNTWYAFTYTTWGKVGTVTATIPTTFATEAVSLTLNPPAVFTAYTVYFRTVSSPGDFTISATGATGTSFSLDALSLKEMVGGYMVADSLRRISVYEPSSGTITVGRAWTAPTAGTEYEIHTMLSPLEINRLINNALGRCYYLDEQEITVVDDQRQYALAAYTWLTNKRQVVDVLWKVGDTALEYQYVSADWFEIRDDEGVLTLDIRPNEYGDTTTLVLRVIRPYDALGTDLSSTKCPLDWVKAGAVLEIYQWLTRNGPAQDVSRYEQAQAKAAAIFSQKCQAYTPRPARRVQGYVP